MKSLKYIKTREWTAEMRAALARGEPVTLIEHLPPGRIVLIALEAVFIEVDESE